ncbi:ribosomal RNA large subunit methyltransferase K/L [Pseudomonas monteilii]|uniref:Ribosomal RNA large subunit methyltransferase K/L n=1 Tax=Pseudomonas monteilii TaxID=76759 RepID=A0AAE6REG5_9PSED|nr:ribosomal RNA large subunit methyltransferase K/L [Pseudomonas monteilii]
MPHYQVEQGVGAAAQVFAAQVDAQVVLDLQHLARQVFACAVVQFVIQREHRQAGKQQHECGAHQCDAQAQAQRQAGVFQKRASST